MLSPLKPLLEAIAKCGSSAWGNAQRIREYKPITRLSRLGIGTVVVLYVVVAGHGLSLLRQSGLK